MGNYLKYSQLAKSLGLHNASINMALKNKTLQSTPENTIDITLPHNRIWIDKQIAKGNEFDLNRIYDKPEKQLPKQREVKIETEIENDRTKKRTKNKEDSLDTLRSLEIRQKKATLLRTEKAIKLDDLRINKQEGLLIPFDEAEFLLVYIVEKIRNTSIQEIDSMTNIYKERFGISHQEYIELKIDLNEILNSIIKESVDELKSGLEGIKDLFKETRERGQRK